MSKTAQVVKSMILPLIVFVVSYVWLFQSDTLTSVIVTGVASVLAVTYLILGTLLKLDGDNSLSKLVDNSN